MTRRNSRDQIAVVRLDDQGSGRGGGRSGKIRWLTGACNSSFNPKRVAVIKEEVKNQRNQGSQKDWTARITKETAKNNHGIRNILRGDRRSPRPKGRPPTSLKAGQDRWLQGHGQQNLSCHHVHWEGWCLQERWKKREPLHHWWCWWLWNRLCWREECRQSPRRYPRGLGGLVG